MLNVFFNPYPGMTADYETGKKCLFLTANTCKKVFEAVKPIEFKANDPDGKDSIKFFSLAADRQGVRYSPLNFLKEYSGRERELIIWFFQMFAKGTRIHNDELSVCEDWELSGFNVSAPILEYALRQDGMAVTISDDNDWKTDFFLFIDQPDELPNIHGQDDCLSLQNWIQKWAQRNLSFKLLLEQQFDVVFCPGAFNTCFPSRHEEKGIIESLKRAKACGYEIDNNLVKIFETKYGNIRELRAYGDGVRIFFTIKNNQPVIGGFYRKSASINQNKAGEYAAERLKKQGYL